MQNIMYTLIIPSVINISPKAILDKIDTHSLQCFTRYIKDYILQSYQEICTVLNCYILAITYLSFIFIFYICLLYLLKFKLI